MTINAFFPFWLPHWLPFWVPTSSFLTFIFSSALDSPFFTQILCSYTHVSLKTLCDVPIHAPLSCYTHTPLVHVLFPLLVSLALPLPLLFFLMLILQWQTDSLSFSRNPGRPTSQYLFFPLFLYCKPGIKPLRWVAEQFCSMEAVNTLGHFYPCLPATPSPPTLL